MANRISRIAALPGLLLLINAAAWAGRGDVDPDYADEGRLAIGPSILLALPGDRLVIGEGTGAGFRLRMVNAIGQNVPDFGDGGVALINSSAAARTFQPEAAALAANGDLIFMGSLSDTGARELLRLDSDGQPVLAFGNRGDGFVEPALTTVGFAVGADGEIVLAEGSPKADGSCGSPARLQRLLPNGLPDSTFGVDGTIEILHLDICSGAQVFGTRADGGVIVGNGHTFVATDAAGDIDPTFGVDGRIIISEIAWPSGLLLPDGGLLIRGLWGVSPIANNTVFMKFDRNGQPDFDFGNGAGSVTVDLGTVLLGDPLGYESINQLALEPDGQHIVAQFNLQHANAGFVCRGIARLTIDGTPDVSFGRNGVTCLNLDVVLLAVQSDGAPLFRFPDSAGDGGIVYRLLPDNSPSPGFLNVAVTTIVVGESERKTSVAIERIAGRDGAVSVNFATANRQSRSCYHSPNCVILSATAGRDYTASSGRLDWASGDDSQHTVTVHIIDDGVDEYSEVFGVDFFESDGAVQLLAAGSSIFITDDEGTATTPPPTPDPTQGPDTSGGGGLISWATPLALLTLLFFRRRRVRRAADSVNRAD